MAKLIKENNLHPSITKIFNPKDTIRKIGGRTSDPKLRILDACSGSGAISLLLSSVLCQSYKPESDIFIRGIDISPKAIALAYQNRAWNEKLGNLRQRPKSRIAFEERDIFEPYHLKWDIIISNPPYISPSQFYTETKKSVRDFEPKMALVPNVPKLVFGWRGNVEDMFYRRLLELHDEAFSKVLLMEVGDAAQAIRVVEIIDKNKVIRSRNKVQFWRDFPDGDANDEQIKMANINGIMVQIKGSGRIRCVVLIRKDSAIPQVGKDIKIMHFRPRNFLRYTLFNSKKRNIYGPPELKATWKLLNSPIGTDGRATRAMSRGWGSQTKAREKINVRMSQELEREKEIKRQNLESVMDIERPLRTKRSLWRKEKFSSDSEPFLLRQYL